MDILFRNKQWRLNELLFGWKSGFEKKWRTGQFYRIFLSNQWWKHQDFSFHWTNGIQKGMQFPEMTNKLVCCRYFGWKPLPLEVQECYGIQLWWVVKEKTYNQLLSFQNTTGRKEKEECKRRWPNLETNLCQIIAIILASFSIGMNVGRLLGIREKDAWRGSGSRTIPNHRPPAPPPKPK